MTAAGALAMQIDRDVDIAVAIRGGSHNQALAMMARAMGESLGRFCGAILGSRPDAEEAAQDALIEALGAMTAFRGESSVRTWLFAIARRVCARRIAQRRRRGALFHLVVVEAERPEGDAVDEAVRAETIRRVRRALLALPGEDRDMIVLRYAADLTWEEAAEACGLTPQAARKRASRAFAVMRETLGDLPQTHVHDGGVP